MFASVFSTAEALISTATTRHSSTSDATSPEVTPQPQPISKNLLPFLTNFNTSEVRKVVPRKIAGENTPGKTRYYLFSPLC